jgi:hemerythrin
MNASWTPALATNVALIDGQHKSLFDHADILLDPSQEAKIPEVLEFLSGYVKKHFHDEEELQVSVSYPKYNIHHNLHEQFEKSFEELHQQAKTTGLTATARGMAKSLVDWLKNHIMVHDIEFAAYYREHKK